ncbi:MAG: gliding motility-associated C-terminal domain-containing protein [Saprospiraceae bacterium]
MRLFILIFCLLASCFTARGQVANDECSRAIFLNNVVNFCSQPGEFNNQGATLSNVARASCFPDETNARDVWFAFVARSSDVNISVIGSTALSPGGTLRTPQIAVYSGTCTNLTQVGCISDGFNTNTAQTFVGRLVIGSVYYIRVSARGGAQGTFQICINSFNQSPKASSDCVSASILCSKDPFTVDFVQGEGLNPNEVTGVCGRFGCQPEEEQSTWFRWTCQQSGTLSFKITPLNPTDDLDFVVFELPNSINDCAGKRALRCMSAGENVGQPFNTWRPCTGATGLRDGERDNIEYCGCDAGSNNFVAPLDMVAGRSYALVVNNFSRSGSGFTIEFGGTGTFVGPTANFTIDQLDACVGKPINLTDSSAFSGGIASWEWYSGPSAAPNTLAGKGPHQLTYEEPGDKYVVLNVKTASGCVVSNVKTLRVKCCGDHFSTGANVANPLCPAGESGSISLNVNGRYAPLTYKWANGQDTRQLQNLKSGAYQVTVSDRSTCDTVLRFSLSDPPPVGITAKINMPTCNGGRDGALEINATGATPPFQFRFPGRAFSAQNKAINLGVGDYLVTARDANGCLFDTLVRVRELELVLDPSVQSVKPPSCNGFSDGAIVVNITNGLGPFQYDWGDGKGFQGANSLNEVKAGRYQVEVRDANLCKGVFDFRVEDFPRLGVEIDRRDISCFGGKDGQAEIRGKGGVGNYSYSWENGVAGSLRGSLSMGTYRFSVKDGNNCVADSFLIINEPPELFILDAQVTPLVCFGDNSGKIVFLGAGGTPPFTYSIGGVSFKGGNAFTGLSAGPYVATVKDSRGCTAAQILNVPQPDLLQVDAGPDQLVDLGEEAVLRAVPSSFPVSYQWAPADLLNCSSCATPRSIPVKNTVFSVTVTDPQGCVAVDEVSVIVVKNRSLFIPNAFSPDSDGANDYFTIYGGAAARNIKILRIFDRWGELLFEAADIPPGSEPLGWDGVFKGKALPAAVYTYYAEVEFIDGEVLLVKGDVTLMR